MDKSEPARDDEERLERVLAWQRAFDRRRARRRRQLVVAGAATLGIGSVLTTTLLGRSLSEAPDRVEERTGALKPSVFAPSSRSLPTGPAISPYEAGKGSFTEVRSSGDERASLADRSRRGSSRVPADPRAAWRDAGRAKAPPSPPRVASPHRQHSAPTAETAAAVPPAAVPSPPPPRVDPEPAPLTSERVVVTSNPPSPRAPSVTPVTPAAPTGPRTDTAKNPRSETMETLKRVMDYIAEMKPREAIERWVRDHPPVESAGAPPLKQGPAEAP